MKLRIRPDLNKLSDIADEDTKYIRFFRARRCFAPVRPAHRYGPEYLRRDHVPSEVWERMVRYMDAGHALVYDTRRHGLAHLIEISAAVRSSAPMRC